MRTNRSENEAPIAICRLAVKELGTKLLQETTATFLTEICHLAAKIVDQLSPEHLRKHARVTKKTSLKFNFFRCLSWSSK